MIPCVESLWGLQTLKPNNHIFNTKTESTVFKLQKQQRELLHDIGNIANRGGSLFKEILYVSHWINLTCFCVSSVLWQWKTSLLMLTKCLFWVSGSEAQLLSESLSDFHVGVVKSIRGIKCTSLIKKLLNCLAVRSEQTLMKKLCC